MSVANRSSKEINAKDRQSTSTRSVASADDRASPTLSVYNVRFPSNICEHQPPPRFVRRTVPLPGRGGGAVVVPTDRPSSAGRGPPPRTTRAPDCGRAASDASEGVQQERKPRQISLPEPVSISRDKMSHSEVKIIKRDAKHR